MSSSTLSYAARLSAASNPTSVRVSTLTCLISFPCYDRSGNTIAYLPASVQITWTTHVWMTLPVRVKPRLRLDPGALPPSSSFVQTTGLDSRLHSHCHVSSFCSLLLNIQLYSPSIKTVKQVRLGGMVSYPVFRDHDKVEGKVILDLNCSQNGQLNISVNRRCYVSVEDLDDESAQGSKTSKYKHIFLLFSAVILILPLLDPLSVFCDMFRVPQLPSDSSLNGPAPRSCEFSFEIPRGSRLGDGIPPTFCVMPCDSRRGGLSVMEKAEVSYGVTAVGALRYVGDQRDLEAPIRFHPDTDFQSMDGSDIAPELWLEMPLTPKQCGPFHCIVTLPRLQTFSQHSSVPYLVKSTIKPRCAVLAREIAANANIAVSLVCKVTIKPHQ
ncbi:hypothetical protein F4604DRAFT_2033754, partial [Suillus subluteus]